MEGESGRERREKGEGTGNKWMGRRVEKEAEGEKGAVKNVQGRRDGE